MALCLSCLKHPKVHLKNSTAMSLSKNQDPLTQDNSQTLLIFFLSILTTPSDCIAASCPCWRPPQLNCNVSSSLVHESKVSTIANILYCCASIYLKMLFDNTTQSLSLSSGMQTLQTRNAFKMKRMIGYWLAGNYWLKQIHVELSEEKSAMDKSTAGFFVWVFFLLWWTVPLTFVALGLK